MRCIGGLNHWLDENNIEGPIEYIMESGQNPQIEEEATVILSNVSASEKLRKKYRLGGYGFREKGPETPWLFAPDYFAWTWQKNDARIEEPEKDVYGDWRSALLPLIEGKPHLVKHLSEGALNVMALVNEFNGLMRRRDDA